MGRPAAREARAALRSASMLWACSKTCRQAKTRARTRLSTLGRQKHRSAALRFVPSQRYTWPERAHRSAKPWRAARVLACREAAVGGKDDGKCAADVPGP